MELQAGNTADVYEKLKRSAFSNLLMGTDGDTILLKMHREKIPAMLKELIQMDIEVLSFHSKNSLEDYFLALTSGNRYADTIKN